MAGKLDWHGPEFTGRLDAEMGRRVQRCCVIVWNRAKALLNVDGTGKGKGGRDKKGRYRKSGLVYGANPSKPGEAPRKQTGRLLGSVAWEADGKTGRVGTNMLVGLWLQLGTRLMAARPWLDRALADCRDECLAILRAPMK